MSTADWGSKTRIKVGVFTLAGILAIALTTVLVNDRPYWWRKCQLVHINVEDATGLKAKSPVRSLGLEIGYLNSVQLTETHVTLGICITAPVEVLPMTRAYLRGEGFLGDKFVELKPVRYQGDKSSSAASGFPASPLPVEPAVESSPGPAHSRFLNWLIPSAHAADPVPPPARPAAPPAGKKGAKPDRQIPVGESGQDMQKVVNRVDSLVNEMTQLTDNLKSVMNPEDLKATMKQLNRTLENASRTLSPEGGLNQTAQRTLAKLEDAIEQLRDLMTRVNQGEGSVGMVLNDPTYAEELREAIRSINRLLGKVNSVRFVVDIGAEQILGYNAGRGWFRLGIWPSPDRYYLVGISVDPRGKRTSILTTTQAAGVTTVTQTDQVEPTALLITGMVGKIFYNRFDLSVGALNGDGTVSLNFLAGPSSQVELVSLRSDVYTRGSGIPIDLRLGLTLRPWGNVYVRAGLESVRTVNDSYAFSFGAGIAFDDNDIKLLFALR